jgi:hypothetical protein
VEEKTIHFVAERAVASVRFQTVAFGSGKKRNGVKMEKRWSSIKEMTTRGVDGEWSRNLTVCAITLRPDKGCNFGT